MCGIAGFLHTDGAEASADLVGVMVKAMHHRGPDDTGVEASGHVGIGASRLSIIDLSSGHQPMVHRSGELAVAQNGEIYNHLLLREELEELGHQFTTSCDTEVLLHGYREWGEGLFPRLQGMFSICIHDRRNGSLILARDRLGIKPLYLMTSAGRVAFASEIKALLKLPGSSRDINPEALDMFLQYKYFPDDLVLFSGITKLLPGHSLSIAADGKQTRKEWWTLADAINAEELDLPEDRIKERLRELMFTSVERRMMSDVPLGAFLSGGVDSTILAGIMARLSPGKVKTFSIGFKEASFDESPYARVAAAYHGTDHQELICRENVLFDLLPELVGAIDEPIGDASILPTYLVSRLARESVTVALSGLGADEILGGYQRHRLFMYRDRWQATPGPLRHLAGRLVHTLPVSKQKMSLSYKIARFVESAELPADQSYERLMRLFIPELRNQLMRGQSSAHGVIASRLNEVQNPDWIARAMYADVTTILPNDYLLKDDRMSMANSLEVRVPFLDHELVEFAARLPARYKIRGKTGKFILRQVCEDLLPPELRQRGKYGFEAPIALWMQGKSLHRIEEFLCSERAAKRDILDVEAIREVLNRHRGGKENAMNQIFALMTLEHWFQQYLD